MKKSNLKVVRIAAAVVFVLAFMLNIHTNLEGETSLFGQQLIADDTGTGTGGGTGSGSGGGGTGTADPLLGEEDETFCPPEYDKIEIVIETINSESELEIGGSIIRYLGRVWIEGRQYYSYSKETRRNIQTSRIRCDGIWGLCFKKDCGE